MKFRELFVDYCDIEDLHIFRVLNLDMFFAIKKGDSLENETMIRFLEEKQVNGLRDGSIAMERIYRATWRSLAGCEERISRLNIILCLSKSYMDMSHHVSSDDPLVLWYQEKAKAREPLAMFILSKMYMSGKGVGFHPGKAMYWGIYAIAYWLVRILKKPVVAALVVFLLIGAISSLNSDRLLEEEAKGKTPDEMVSMGFSRELVDKYDEAVYWYEKAAIAGNAEAMARLAHLNRYSSLSAGQKGIKKNLSKSAYWYEKAADAGDVLSMKEIGLMYESGTGVTQNPDKAAYWFEKVAESGDVGIMRDLALVYELGMGVPRDLDKAAYWYKKADETKNAVSYPKADDS